MCGIAGFYGFQDDALIKKFSKELEHRGPDGEGLYIDKNVTLLSRRLAIIDRKGGDQPIYNEDKSIAVVYNGEIYNYKELRAELEAAGHKFSTKSDTEIIVHGYEEWGEEAFDRYNGMFGAALYDIKQKKLILARDHFGIKPLYYITPSPSKISSRLNSSHEQGSSHTKSRINFEGSVIFSSEIKPLINSGFIEKKPNDRIIYRYLRYRIHDDSEETFFAGVYKLMPGEMMVVDKNGMKKMYFSKLKEELQAASLDSSQARNDTQTFKDKLIESIRMRLMSEVPVGTALSGGLDSSTVVAVINKLLAEHAKDSESVGKNQNTFSAVFPNAKNDEERYIDALLKEMKNVKSHKVYPTPETFFEEIEDFVRTQEEPTISTGPYAQYKVMEEAHKFVTVLLDGQGADEMMAGYLPYYFVYLRQLKAEGKYWKLLREVMLSMDVITKYLRNKLKPTLSSVRLMNKEFLHSYNDERFTINNNNLKKRLIEDIFHNSLPSLLRYEDKNTMRFSIEGRVPFLDFNLLKYLFSLDESVIIKNGWNKHILRQAVDGLLPAVIRKRRNKIGFTTPEDEWFMRMKNRIYAYFLSESFASRKYFNQQNVVKAFEDYIKGKNDDTMLFWRILNLELWLREFIDTPSQKIVKEVKKQVTINVDSKKYERYPLRTNLIAKGDDIFEKLNKPTNDFLRSKIKDLRSNWFVVVSEKIVAISQGRSYFIWDIKTGFWAKTLSSFVTKTPYGIGLGSPWTMQLAINEVGLPRMIVASMVGAVGKVLGMKGLFYRVAGKSVNAIDGPTEYSLYPSNVSAKLPPSDPQKVAEMLAERFRESLPKNKLQGFQGVVIIDANDLGRNVLGNATKYENTVVEEIFRDNPMGQGSEQTPLTLVFEH